MTQTQIGEAMALATDDERNLLRSLQYDSHAGVNPARAQEQLDLLLEEIFQRVEDTAYEMDDGSRSAPNMTMSFGYVSPTLKAAISPRKVERKTQADDLIVARLNDTINRLLSAGVSRQCVAASLLVVSQEFGDTSN